MLIYDELKKYQENSYDGLSRLYLFLNTVREVILDEHNQQIFYTIRDIKTLEEEDRLQLQTEVSQWNDKQYIYRIAPNLFSITDLQTDNLLVSVTYDTDTTMVTDEFKQIISKTTIPNLFKLIYSQKERVDNYHADVEEELYEHYTDLMDRGICVMYQDY